MLGQSKGGIENLLNLEKKIVDGYRNYVSEVENGEMRKACEALIDKHSLHIKALQKYNER